MKVFSIQQNINFKTSDVNNSKNKREFIDVFTDAVKNPRDVNDCVAVPRGIFKAYLLIMSGSATLALSGLIPQKAPALKKCTIALGWILNTLSAVYFAKPFVVKSLNPTVKKEDINK